MLTSEIISHYLNKVTEGIKSDAAAKSQKIPVSSFRVEADSQVGRLFGADYFKYLVTGRGPGKQPPPDKMLKFVQDNPDILAEARQRFKYITEKGLAYLIGRKIGREGTDIFTGKKPGIDLEGAINAPMEDFLKQLAYHEALNIGGQIREAAAA
jgi:hypothetical protein